jgi:hypothetical protein
MRANLAGLYAFPLSYMVMYDGEVFWYISRIFFGRQVSPLRDYFHHGSRSFLGNMFLYEKRKIHSCGPVQ